MSHLHTAVDLDPPALVVKEVKEESSSEGTPPGPNPVPAPATRHPRLTKDERLTLAKIIFEHRDALFDPVTATTAWQTVQDTLMELGSPVEDVERLRTRYWGNLRRSALKRARGEGEMTRAHVLVLKALNKMPIEGGELDDDPEDIKSSQQSQVSSSVHGLGVPRRGRPKKLKLVVPPTEEEEEAILGNQETEEDEPFSNTVDCSDYLARQQRLEAFEVERTGMELELLRMRVHRERELGTQLIQEQIKTEQMKQKLIEAQMLAFQGGSRLPLFDTLGCIQ